MTKPSSDSDIEKQIGAKITEMRLSKYLTQSQLAEKVNVSNETISRLERGITMPSLKTLEKIAHCLEIPLSTLFEYRNTFPKDQLHERELAKCYALLKKQSLKKIILAYSILKVIFGKIKI